MKCLHSLALFFAFSFFTLSSSIFAETEPVSITCYHSQKISDYPDDYSGEKFEYQLAFHYTSKAKKLYDVTIRDFAGKTIFYHKQEVLDCQIYQTSAGGFYSFRCQGDQTDNSVSGFTIRKNSFQSQPYVINAFAPDADKAIRREFNNPWGFFTHTFKDCKIVF